jgi:hypothetical protein
MKPAGRDLTTRQQTTYFGPDGLLRRHDYAVDILGGSLGAQYIAAYREFDGIVMPTRRLVLSRGRDNVPVREPVLVPIHIDDITFGR